MVSVCACLVIRHLVVFRAVTVSPDSSLMLTPFQGRIWGISIRNAQIFIWWFFLSTLFFYHLFYNNCPNFFPFLPPSTQPPPWWFLSLRYRCCEDMKTDEAWFLPVVAHSLVGDIIDTPLFLNSSLNTESQICPELPLCARHGSVPWDCNYDCVSSSSAKGLQKGLFLL